MFSCAGHNVFLVSVFVLINVFWTEAGPSFIKPCSLSDPKLNECALKHAQEAYPIIIKGLKEYKIPNYTPIRVSEIKIDGQNLQMKFTDITSNALSQSAVTKMTIDDEKKTWAFTFEADDLEISGNYEIKGRILVLAISGEGPANVTYTKPTYSHTMTYKEVERNADNYLELVSSEGKFVFDRVQFRFNNLFNGDKRLGDEMNAFLNENWKAFEEELHPSVLKLMKLFMDNAIKNIFAKVPKSEIFLP